MLPLEKAKYHAHAVAVSFGTSENNNTQIAVQFSIVDPEDFAGETIAWIGHFTDKTTERTIESLQHAGWAGDDLSELDGLDEQGVRNALPDIVELVCEAEEYKEKWQLRVQWVNKMGGGRFAFKQPLTGGDLKAFAAQMRSTVQSLRGGGSAPKQRQVARQQSAAHQPAVQHQTNSTTNGSTHPNAPGGWNPPRNDIPF
jgi:hypothetical protein